MEVAVKADSTEIEDRGGGAHDVCRQPDITQSPAERPPTHHVVGNGERHHRSGDEHVGHRQRHEEVVAGLPQRPVRQDRRDHQQVPGHREDDDQRQHDRQGEVGGQSDATTVGVVVLRRVPDRRDGRRVVADRGGGVDARRPIHDGRRETRSLPIIARRTT